MELLRLEHVTKRIKNKVIVDDLSLTINSGEIVGFLGPNGAGKTTTIKMIVGLLSISEGKISVCGSDIVSDFEKAIRNIGGIVENPDLYKKLSGRQNLQYFASMYGKEAEDNIDDVLKMVKMSDRADDKVRTYSLGMRQRIGLAQALLHMPSLLVLDEPTNGMDPLGIKEMRELLRNLSENSDIGVFVSSHILAEMELLCDRIYIIDNGKIIDEKTMADIKNSGSEETEYIFRTSDNQRAQELLSGAGIGAEIKNGGISVMLRTEQINTAVTAIIGEGIILLSFSPVQRTLEDDFILVTEGTKNQIR